jgi:endonuclease YncB( thermonuclease family)
MRVLKLTAALSILGVSTASAQTTSPLIRVVDGDTWAVFGGETIRELGIDAPESRYLFGRELWACDAEKALGDQAKARLEELLLDGPIRIETNGDRDRYDRLLARAVLPDGRYAGDVLIEEGLAVPWAGRQHDWCGPIRPLAETKTPE